MTLNIQYEIPEGNHNSNWMIDVEGYFAEIKYFVQDVQLKNVNL